MCGHAGSTQGRAGLVMMGPLVSHTLLCLSILLPVLHADPNCTVYNITAQPSLTSAVILAANTCSPVGNYNSTLTSNGFNVTNLGSGSTYNVSLSCSGTVCSALFTTIPNVIRGLSVTNISTTSLSLTWNDSLGMRSFYRVQCNQSVINTSDTCVTLSNLSPGTLYNVTVTTVAVDNVTVGDAVVRSQYTRPGVISALSVYNVTNTALSLSWSSSAGSASFFRVDWAGGSRNSTDTRVTLTGLNAGTVYTVRVAAVAADNVTAADPLTVSQFTRPDVVCALSVADVSVSSVFLNWTQPSGNCSYYIVMWSYNNVTKNQTTSSTVIRVLNLTAGTQYTFTVSAVAADNVTAGAAVNVSQFTRPAQPQNITAVYQGSSSLQLMWSAPAGGVCAYSVFVTNIKLNVSMSQTVTSTTASVLGLYAGVIYSVSVSAVSGAYSNTSDPVQLATKPNPPGALRVTGKTNSSINITWDRPALNISFNYSITYGSFQSNVTLLSSLNAVQLPNLTSGTEYCVFVETLGVQGLSSTAVDLCDYTIPNAVQNLRLALVAPGSALMEWDSPANVQMCCTYYVTISSLSDCRNFTTEYSSVNITGLSLGVQYNVSVTTVMGNNANGPSAFLFLDMKPRPADNVTAVTINSTTVSLGWTSLDYNHNTYGFLVFVYQGSSNTQNRTTTDKNITITGLMPGANYTFVIVTVLNSLQSDPVSVTKFTYPERVTNITAFGSTVNMSVWWNQPRGNVAWFRVNLYRNGSLTANRTLSTNQPVVFTNLQPAQIYNISITTSSGPFQVESAVVQNATYPSPPTALMSVQQTPTSLNFTWSSPADVDMSQCAFIVYLQASQTRTAVNWILLPNLTSATQYNVTVVTVGPMNYQSLPVTLSTYTTPNSVIGLRASLINTTSITLAWEPPDTRTVYKYDITVQNSSLSQMSQITVNTATVAGLRSGTNYTFTVMAVGPDGTAATTANITLYTRPYPVSGFQSGTVNSSAVYLNWSKPSEYKNSYSYRVETSGCLPVPNNQTVLNQSALLTGLISGTQCSFSVYSQAANGIEGQQVTVSQYTLPEEITPVLTNGGRNDSLTVKWKSPQGNVDNYIINMGESTLSMLNSSARSFVLPNLRAGTLYTVSLTTVSGPFNQTSQLVSNATYPNPPGSITVYNKTVNSMFLQWTGPTGMDGLSISYKLSYHTTTANLSTTSTTLTGLASGTSYNISVSTWGQMAYLSEAVNLYLVTTRPEEVCSLSVNSTSTDSVSLTWDKSSDYKSTYTYRVLAADAATHYTNITTASLSYKVLGLSAGSMYSVSVTTLAWDGTASSDAELSICTDAAPVDNAFCQGPNLTAALLTLNWTTPQGSNQGFKIQAADVLVEVVAQCNQTCSYNLTSLSYNTQYSVSVWTLGCGHSSSVTLMSCKTGITVPPTANVDTVQVSQQDYKTFTLQLEPSLFNNTNGPIGQYGVLVTSDGIGEGEDPSSLSQYLNKTYEDWNLGHVSAYLAVVKQNPSSLRSSAATSVIIGDGSAWQKYSNGPLKASASYRFSVVLFTRLEQSDGLVDVSKSYFSISDLYQGSVTLPQNPAVIGSIAGTVVFIFLLFIIIITVVLVVLKRQKKPALADIPIQSIRNKVSEPIKLEDFESYFRRQESSGGFAEEFESLKPVGVSQAKSSALALENKGKNRYNNVLPYDSSRVKLSTHGSPHDDYINANYMPGYNTRKEFIAAQGPLPSTVNEFWRMVWEKNVHTLVMLTRCTEQGRVKCEEYWPSGSKHYSNITVTLTAEIPMEDWTIRDMSLKNVKTVETRLLRQFHFTAWPDHGVPETPELLINFRHLVREHMDQFSCNTPTVVHCSAGVGRTGTFIAIDHLIFQIEREELVDVFGTIHDLRMHRTLMVQTEDQYTFLNQCALDIIRSRTGTNVDLIYQNTSALTIYENFEPKSKNGYRQT